MQTEELKRRMQPLGDWYHRIDFGNGVSSPAIRNQQIEFDIISPFFRGGSLAGKRVLEIGSNAGGLTKLLAAEADEVTAMEPVEPFISQAKLVKDYFDLKNVNLVNDTVFNAHKYGKFDVIVFHGLVYHLRHPQFVLDMLGHICTGQIFVSSQVCDSEDPILRNRRANTRFKREGKSQRYLLGWEPSPNALSRMIELAGFRNPMLISQRTPQKPHPGEGNGILASNDVYYVADAALEPVAVPYLFAGREGYGF